MKKNNNPTQCARLMEFLESHECGITQYEALTELGIMRLASRVSEMKKRGEPILTKLEIVQNRWGEKCFVAKYFLEK
jgi:hypothetical protein